MWQVDPGDAFELLPTLSTDSVDLVLTSPPYWGMRTYGLPHDFDVLDKWLSEGGSAEQAPSYDWYRSAGGLLGLEPFPEWFVDHLVELLRQARPALRAAGSLWINLGDTYFARWASIREGRQGMDGRARHRRRTPSGDWRQDKQLMLIPARFAIAMQADGWILRNDLIWAKPNVAPRPERDRLRLAHEHLFHFVQRRPSARASYYYDLSGAEPAAVDVVHVAVSTDGEGHTATFPEDLVRPRIMSSCPPGGLVVDPFCGTGTTLAASLRAGRRAIGFDLNDAFVELARAKCAEALPIAESAA